MTTVRRSGSDSFPTAVPVYILAGDKSRRFGSDKARALHRGAPLITGVARALEPVASRITVVAAASGAYDDLGLPTIGDVLPDKGPMGGLLSAIDDCRGAQWLLLSACDWVGIQERWARLLLARRQSSLQVIIFRSDRLEPLFALYHTSIRKTAARLIDDDRLKMIELIDTVTTETVPAPGGWSDVINLNRPPDYR
ncbi:MAG: molybdenum cofactor guanylyltransferase [Candidatus Krumholzibacteria bacterium]|nr:molybdenum cofactor guanylyltransferase [Candidatus Krumholzibacteria bacterium]